MYVSSQDDANNDPQWSEEQLLVAGFELAGVTIGRCEVDIMSKSTVAIFEVLEKAWATQNCTLVDMKVLLRHWTGMYFEAKLKQCSVVPTFLIPHPISKSFPLS